LLTRHERSTICVISLEVIFGALILLKVEKILEVVMNSVHIWEPLKMLKILHDINALSCILLI
jgi:hypothetical protein